MSAVIHGWTLESKPQWITADARFTFYRNENGWSITALTLKDYHIQKGADIPSDIDASLRTCAQLCADFSGCSHRLRRAPSFSYRVAGTPLQITRHTKHRWSFSRQIPSSTSMIYHGIWAAIIKELHLREFPTRSEALKTLSICYEQSTAAVNDVDLITVTSG